MESTLLTYIGQIPAADRFDASKGRADGGKISDAIPISHDALTTILTTVMIVPDTGPDDTTSDLGTFTADVNSIFTSTPSYRQVFALATCGYDGTMTFTPRGNYTSKAEALAALTDAFRKVFITGTPGVAAVSAGGSGGGSPSPAVAAAASAAVAAAAAGALQNNYNDVRSHSRLGADDITALLSDASFKSAIGAATTGNLPSLQAAFVVPSPPTANSSNFMKAIMVVTSKSTTAAGNQDAKKGERATFNHNIATIKSVFRAGIQTALETDRDDTNYVVDDTTLEAAADLVFAGDFDAMFDSIYLFSSFEMIVAGKTDISKMHIDQIRDAIQGLFAAASVVWKSRIGAGAKAAVLKFITDITSRNRDAKVYPGGYIGILNGLIRPLIRLWSRKWGREVYLSVGATPSPTAELTLSLSPAVAQVEYTSLLKVWVEVKSSLDVATQLKISGIFDASSKNTIETMIQRATSKSQPRGPPTSPTNSTGKGAKGKGTGAKGKGTGAKGKATGAKGKGKGTSPQGRSRSRSRSRSRGRGRSRSQTRGRSRSRSRGRRRGRSRSRSRPRSQRRSRSRSRGRGDRGRTRSRSRSPALKKVRSILPPNGAPVTIFAVMSDWAAFLQKEKFDKQCLFARLGKCTPKSGSTCPICSTVTSPRWVPEWQVISWLDNTGHRAALSKMANIWAGVDKKFK
jgi:hypothetical protein